MHTEQRYFWSNQQRNGTAARTATYILGGAPDTVRHPRQTTYLITAQLIQRRRADRYY